jgi:FkbM family methyltransferase
MSGFGIMNLRCPPSLARYMQDVWEGEYHFLLPFDGAPTVVDVGACIGAFARWVQAKYECAEIYCFEPNPKVHGMLEANTKDMRPPPTIAKVAVVTPRKWRELEGGMVTLYNGRNNVGETSIEAVIAGTGDGVQVPALNVEALPDCDVLKLDCEGHEPELVRAYLATPRRPRPAGIMLEYHSIEDAMAVQKLAVEQEYRIAKWLEHGAGRGVVCMRTLK